MIERVAFSMTIPGEALPEHPGFAPVELRIGGVLVTGQIQTVHRVHGITIAVMARDAVELAATERMWAERGVTP